MDSEPTAEAVDVAALTSEIVAAYVVRNKVNVADLPDLMAEVYAALTEILPATEVDAVRQLPIVAIRKSVASKMARNSKP